MRLWRPLHNWFAHGLPSIGGRLPVVGLGHYPSRCYRLSALEHQLDLDPGTEIWIKRDDETGGAFGISKMRKLEHYLGHALACGSERLATLGPLGSNHALATAVLGRMLGFKVDLYLWPEPITELVVRVLRAELAVGARLELVGRGRDDEAFAQTPPELEGPEAGSATTFMPPAGTDPIGAMGYVECGLELAQQVCSAELPRPDFVHVPGGTGGVGAGLSVGLSLAGAEMEGVRIVCVRAVGAGVLSTMRLCLLAAGLRRRLSDLASCEVGGAVGVDHFRLIDDQVGGGYGAPTVAGRRARRLFRTYADIELDLVYTAKAAAGLLDFVCSSEGQGRRHLFLHTYAQPQIDLLASYGGWQELPTPFAELVAHSGYEG